MDLTCGKLPYEPAKTFGSDADEFFEAADEMTLVGETAGEGNVYHRKARVAQQAK